MDSDSHSTRGMRTWTRTRTRYFKILWTRTLTRDQGTRTRTRTLKNGRVHNTGNSFPK